MKIRRKTSEPRNTTINIRVSYSERERIRELASAEGTSIGAYLLSLALGDTGETTSAGEVMAEQMRLDV